MLAVDVGIDHAAAERAGAVQGVGGDQVADIVRPHALEELADAVRFQLKDPLGVTALQQLESFRIVERKVL